MTAFFKLYAVSFVAFLALDAVWMGLVTRNFSPVQMGDLLRSDHRLPGGRMVQGRLT